MTEPRIALPVALPVKPENFAYLKLVADRSNPPVSPAVVLNEILRKEREGRS